MKFSAVLQRLTDSSRPTSYRHNVYRIRSTNLTLTPPLIDDLNLIREYIDCETIIPTNVDEVPAKVVNFVLDNPFSGSANFALIAFDIPHRAAFDSL